VTELPEDEILAKAQQLSREAGRMWLWGPAGYGHMGEDSLRAEYLKQAQEILRLELNERAAMPLADAPAAIIHPSTYSRIA
jgi:hypothetical protein